MSAISIRLPNSPHELLKSQQRKNTFPLINLLHLLSAFWKENFGNFPKNGVRLFYDSFVVCNVSNGSVLQAAINVYPPFDQTNMSTTFRRRVILFMQDVHALNFLILYYIKPWRSQRRKHSYFRYRWTAYRKVIRLWLQPYGFFC